MVSGFGCTVLPDATCKDLELLGRWCVKVALCVNAGQRSSAPTVELVVPKV